MVRITKKKLFVCFFLLFLLLTGFLGYCFSILPSVQNLKKISFQEPNIVYSSDNELIDTYGTIKRYPVNYEQIPQQLIHAFIAIEDRNFFQHHGVELKGLLRAMFILVTTGKKQQGGSTITMQVARNFYLSRKKTYFRKILEILLSFKIEYTFSKQDILYLYLNKIFFGNQAYGIKAAAHIYYGKALAELSLAENAMLAGLPKAPSTINPLRNPTKAKNRRNQVLYAMFTEKFINKEEYLQNIQAPLTAKRHTLPKNKTTPYLHQLINKELRELLPNHLKKGLKIYTSINNKMQNTAAKILQTNILNYAKNTIKQPIAHITQPETRLSTLKKYPTYNILFPAIITNVTENHIYLLTKNHFDLKINNRQQYKNLQEGDLVYLYSYQQNYLIANLPKLQGTIISIHPQTGAIRTLIGGFDHKLSSFNRATQAKLQPGSTLKPFIYLAALANGYTPASLFNDAPLVFTKNDHELWRPKNDNKKFSGLTSLREALMHSKNLVSIRLLEQIGLNKTLTFLKKLGFKENQLPHDLSLALGTGSITPLQLTSSYSIIANGGYKINPYLIEKITNNQNQVIYQRSSIKTFNKSSAPIIDPRDAYIMTDLLKDVIKRGTGRRALILNRPDIAGKTGTTNKLFDNWFIGYNHSLVTTIWVGFDQPQSIGLYASQTALPIWIDFMTQLKNILPIKEQNIPPGIVNIKINPKTGLRTRLKSKSSYFELFKKEHQPPLSKKIKTTPQTNLSDLF